MENNRLHPLVLLLLLASLLLGMNVAKAQGVTATLSGPPRVLDQNPFNVTVTFSEPVTIVSPGADNFTIVNGIYLGFSQNSDRVWVLSVSPQNRAQVDITFKADQVSTGEGIHFAIANAVSNKLEVRYGSPDDPPSATATTTVGIIGVGGARVVTSRAAFDITITFNKPVFGFALGDIIVSGGRVAFTNFVDGASVYTVRHTPSFFASSYGLFVLGAAVQDAEGTFSVRPDDGSDRLTVFLDNIRPTLTEMHWSTDSDSLEVTTLGEVTLTATFTEPVTGFDATDLVILNAGSTVNVVPVVTPVAPTDGPIVTARGANYYSVYTIRFSLPADLTSGSTLQIRASTLPNTFSATVRDVAENGPTTTSGATVDGARVTYNSLDPLTAMLAGPATANTVDTIEARVMFNKLIALSTLVADDFTISTGSSISNIRVDTADTTGRTYLFEITPPDNTNATITVTLRANTVEAPVGGNQVSNQLSITYDGTRPTFIFQNQPIRVSNVGFAMSARATERVDHSRGTPAASTFTSSELSRSTNVNYISGQFSTTENGTLFRFTLIADGTPHRYADARVTEGVDGTNTITMSIPEGIVTDEAGNPNQPTNLVRIIYVPPPTVTVDVPDTVIGQAPFDIPVTFRDASRDIVAVTGFTAADITVTNSDTRVLSGSGGEYTLRVTPDGNGDMVVTIPGNPTNRTANNISVSGTRPLDAAKSDVATSPMTVKYLSSLDVSLSPAVPTSIDSTTPFTTTVTFGTAVTDFDANDVVISTPANATVEVTATASANVYNIEITPTGSGSFDFSINGMVAVGAVMVPVSTTPTTVAYRSGDRPTLAIAPVGPVTPTFLHNSAEFDVTVTFNEAVVALETSASAITTIFDYFTISENATVKALTRDSATKYTVRIGPSFTDAANQSVTIIFKENRAYNLADNTIGNARSLTLSVPYNPGLVPTVQTSASPANFVANTAFRVTATFSEPVQLNAGTPVTVSNNATATLVPDTTNSYTTVTIFGTNTYHTTYTLTITPNTGTTEDITFEIPAGAANDPTGNPNIALGQVLVLAPTIVADTTPPTLLSLIGSDGTNDFAVTDLSTFDLTVTFSENVTGFTDADVTINNNIASHTVTGVTPSPDGSASIYTLAITPGASLLTGDEMTISLTPTGVEDVADIALATLSDTTSITVTYAPPTTMRLTGPGDSTARYEVSTLSPFSVTATFTAPVTGFTEEDINVSASASGASPVNASSVVVAPATGQPTSGAASVYTVTITPADNTPVGQTFSIIATLVGVQDAATNPVTSPEGSLVVEYAPPSDGTAPTLLSIVGPATVTTRDDFMVTVTFSEPVEGFEADDVTFNSAVGVQPSTSITVARATGEPATGPATVYTLTLTQPTALSANGFMLVQVKLDATITDAATNPIDTTGQNDQTSKSLALFYDPPFAVTLAGPTTAIGTTIIEVTATFSEVLTTAPVADNFTISTGSITSITPDTSGLVYTLVISPPDNTNATITVSLAQGVITTGTSAPSANPASNVVTITYDGTRPTVRLIDFPAAVSNVRFSGNVSFSEIVTHGRDSRFISTDVTRGNANRPPQGQTAIEQPIDSDGNRGALYKIYLDADGTGDVTLNILEGVTEDVAGNRNVALEAPLTIPYIAPPTATWSQPTARTDLTPFEITVTFKNALDALVVVTGFDVNDITVTNSTGQTLSGSGSEYTLTVTPDGTGDITITIPGTDTLTGNVNVRKVVNGVPVIARTNVVSTVRTVNYTTVVDTTAPSLTHLTRSGAPSSAFTVNNRNPFTLDATFSEPVDGLIPGNFAVSPTGSATVTAVADHATNPNIKVVTITPAAALSAGTAIDIRPSDSFVTSVTDGTNFVEASTALARATYNPAPTVTLSNYPTTPVKGGTSFDVTAQFSADVTGFDETHVTITPANLVSVAVDGTGSTYTLTITPTVTGSYTIDIAIVSGAIMNNVASTPVVSVTFDNVAPTMTLRSGGGQLHTLTTLSTDFQLTATFSEPVTGFDAGDIQVLDGDNTPIPDDMVTITVTRAPGQPASGPASVYTVAIRPPSNLQAEGTIIVTTATLNDDTNVIDGAGNIATPAPLVVIVTYTPPPVVDNTVPAITSFAGPYIVGSLTPHIVNSLTPFDLVVSFNVIPAYAINAVTVANGDITNSSSSSNGLTHTLTITPTFTLGTTGEIVVTFPASIISNPLSSPPVLNSGVFRHPVPYDSEVPTLVSLLASGSSTLAVDDLEAFDITATFSEPVSNFIAFTNITTSVTSVPSFGISVEGVSPINGRASVYRVTFSPPTDLAEGVFFITVDLAGVRDASNNVAVTPDPPIVVTVTYTPTTITDTTPPTLDSVFGPDGIANTVNDLNPFEIIVTFSESVTGFDENDVTVSQTHSTSTPVAPESVVVTSPDRRIYTVTITPARTTPSGQTFTILTNSISGVEDLADLPLGTVVSSAPTVTYTDNTAPTLDSLVGGPDSTRTFNVATREFEITATFSEDVTGIDGTDFIATSPGITANSVITAEPVNANADGSASVYTVTITLPAATPSDQTYTIFATSLVGEDLASNPVTSSTRSAFVTYDPPFTVTLAGPTTAIGTTIIEVTATFSEVLTTAPVADNFTISTGTDSITSITPNTSGLVYTLVISPPVDTTTITVSLALDAITTGTSAPSANPASNVVTITYDGTRPTVRLLNFPTAVSNVNFTGEVRFDEIVSHTRDSRFQSKHLTRTNAAYVAPGIQQPMDSDGNRGALYMVTLLANGNGNVEFDIVEGIIEDVAGNLNEALEDPLTIPYIAPPTATWSQPAARTDLTPFEITVTFTEDVGAFTAGDITITNAMPLTDANIAPVPNVDTYDTEYTLTVTPDGTGNITITIPGTDTLTGNVNVRKVVNDVTVIARSNVVSTVRTVTYAPPAPDTTAPTLVSLTQSGFLSTAFNVITRNPFTLDATFSEPVTGLIPGNFTVTPAGSATVTAVVDHGTNPNIKVVTITPAAALSAGTMITIRPSDSFVTSVTDGTNFVEASTILAIATYTPPDDSSPTLVSLIGPSGGVVNSLGSFVVTATFSEDVDGFDANDISVTPTSRVDSFTVTPTTGFATVYTVTITPDSDTPSGQTFTISATSTSGVQDSDDNDLETVSNSVGQTTVTYTSTTDDTPPTLISVVGPNGVATTVNDLTSFEIIVTFSEPVNGFTRDDISVSPTTTDATMVAPTSVVVTPGEGASVYTVTITPARTTPSNQAFTILTNINGVVDLSTNPFASATPSGVTVTYIDNTAPTLNSLVGGPNDATTFNVTTRVFEITATFSEDVRGIDETDFSATSTGISVDSVITVEPVNANADGSASVYTLTITLPVTTPSGQTYTIFANNLVGEDLAGNTVPTPGSAAVVTYTPPLAATLTGAPIGGVFDNTPFDVDITFRADTTTFDTSMIQVTNATESSFSTDTGSPITGVVNITPTTPYKISITPDGVGDMVITIPAGSIGYPGGTNTRPISHTVLYDAPPSSVTVVPSGHSLSVKTLEEFDVTITFSEVVTFFSDSASSNFDVENGLPTGFEVRNGSSTGTSLSSKANLGSTTHLSSDVFTVSITPDGNGDIKAFILPNSFRDSTGKLNARMELFTVPFDLALDTDIAATEAAITDFMLKRSNQLTTNQPNLSRFLQGDDCSDWSASNTNTGGTNSGNVTGCVSRGDAWGEINSAWSGANSYTLISAGGHGFVRNDTLIGGMLQLDMSDDDGLNITGKGWLAGPYFVHKMHEESLVFEGRLLFGKASNDISITSSLPTVGTYSDSFNSNRRLAQFRLTGDYDYELATLTPLVDFTYTEDTQDAYTNKPGNLIKGQKVDLMQMKFGLDFKVPMHLPTDMPITLPKALSKALSKGSFNLIGGVSGIYSETSGGINAPSFEGTRARTELGINYRQNPNTGPTVRATTFYDGINTSYESYGLSISVDMEF